MFSFIAYLVFLLVGICLGLALGYAVRDAEHKSKTGGINIADALNSGDFDAAIARAIMRNNRRRGQEA